MKVLIVEPNQSGHRAVYLAHLVRGLRKLPVSLVLVVGKGARESEGFRANLATILDGIEVDEGLPSHAGRPWEIAQATGRGLIEAIDRHQADYAYLPYGDGVGQVMGLRQSIWGLGCRPGCPVEIILHHSQQAYPSVGLKHKLSLALQRRAWRYLPFDVIHHVDRLEYECWQSKGLAIDRSRFLPDPVDAPQEIAREEAVRRLGLETNRRFIGTTGLIDTRKGCDRLIAAFVQADMPDDVSLLLVGRQNERIKELLAGPYAQEVRSGRIVAINRFVSLEELHLALSAMHFVVVAHPRHPGISSIAIRATACQRPVLGTSYGWIEHMIDRFNLGWTCDVEDLTAFSTALEAGVERAMHWRRGEAAERFVAFHSDKNFELTITAALRRRLGLPPVTDIITWEWMLPDASILS